ARALGRPGRRGADGRHPGAGEETSGRLRPVRSGGQVPQRALPRHRPRIPAGGEGRDARLVREAFAGREVISRVERNYNACRRSAQPTRPPWLQEHVPLQAVGCWTYGGRTMRGVSCLAATLLTLALTFGPLAPRGLAEGKTEGVRVKQRAAGPLRVH